jgi:carbonic anhydrase
MRRRTVLVQMASLATMLAVRWRAGAEETAHWGYDGPTGPEHWGKEFPACAGRSQSPVDIKTAKKVSGHPIEFHYADSRLRVINNGHTVQVNCDEGSYIAVDGTQYQLIQFHFHRPSEERIQGRAYAFVAHLVHRSREGELAVVAAFFREGPNQPLIETIWQHLPGAIGEELTAAETKINAGQLLPKGRGYYRYAGSLTTPPCTEGVKWNILTTPGTVSRKQLAAFPFKMNARPVQPLNGRLVEED